MLRRYTLDDIDFIVDLEKKTLHSTLDKDYYLNDLNNNFAYHYVLEEDKLIGFISTIFDGEIAEVLNFCIDPLCQGKGHGLKLLESYLKMIYSLGANSVVLEVRASNTKAINLYNKCGFKVIRTRKAYYNNGEDALFMSLILGAKYGKD